MSPPVSVATHLYVMQAADGRIKVGRSANPQRRCRDLQTSSGRKMEVLAILQGAGDRELEAHQLLTKFRTIGEWFRNTSLCRKKLCKIFGQDIHFPFSDRPYRNRRSSEAEIEAMTQAAIDAVRKRARARTVSAQLSAYIPISNARAAERAANRS